MRKKREKTFNFKPLGAAIKAGREDEDLTREQVAEKMDINPRYYAKIEDDGQYPSLGLLYSLVKMFRVSVDEHFSPNTERAKTAKRKYIESLLDKLSDHELQIIEGTAKGILRFKETKEQEDEDNVLVHL